MSRSWQPSNQPIRYDRKRVAQLEPIEAAIGRLRLSIVRVRKLRAILNAIEVQIEDGGDSPEVNRLLLDALRAAVRHQVGEREGKDVLRAIVTFENAEARRWEQVKAGTLPPIELTDEERLDDLMQQGYKRLRTSETTSACDHWLEAWELIKQLATPEMRTPEDFDAAYPGMMQSVFNWSGDLEMHLHNAGIDDPSYHEERVRYVREFLAQFPDANTNMTINFLRAEGEALWLLGRREESEAVFTRLIERFPDEGWGYIGWADNYWLFDSSAKEYEQAEQILRKALERPNLNDRRGLLERLEKLYAEWGKPQEQAEIAAELKQSKAEELEPPRQTLPLPRSLLQAMLSSTAPKKPGRNDPCWCGSGRKYKQCHWKADQKKG
ncbi:MAG: SEC-C metal-binding domain-containing protein [Ardenticatenaceae bacterium]|nr:SEC-C metal-binding domain-containing protein [Ardenticatenaceae bacterium]